MKRQLIIATAALCCLGAQAQETYESAKLINEDLNGTARYVGMGGAMEALGADISTMGSNPAGIGLFRRSNVSASAGLVTQNGAKDFADSKKTNASFDQIGFVYSMRSSKRSFINFGFNYHKSKNFDQILSAAGRINGASQNKLSYVKGAAGVFDEVRYGTTSSDGSFHDVTPGSGNGAWLGVNRYGSDYYESGAFNQADYLYYNVFLADNTANTFYYEDATAYDMKRGSHGYIGEYDFNLSGNSKDRFYWGVTFGLHDVHYNDASSYIETLDASDGGATELVDERRITGTGFDIKAGVIFRPVATSPFRVGLYVHTPTWYDLTTTNSTTLAYSSQTGGASGQISDSYDFKFFTPWKFGISLGHTIGTQIALGATYEYADYGTADIRVNDGGYYDYWGSYVETSSSDDAMNDNVKKVLRGVSTLKLGMEFKPTSNLALRLGYNYVSPQYSSDGYKDGTIESYGNYYASTTDYTNWKATNRLTAGVGYTHKNWNVDLAYQYSRTEGDFSPFMSYYPGSGDDADLKNVPDGCTVKNIRQQLVLTLGYRF